MELNNEYLFNEAQRMCRIGTFIYDIKKDICIKSDTLNEILGINNDYPNNFESWLNTIDPNQRSVMKLYLEKVISTGSEFNKEYKVINQVDGTEIWVMQKGKVYFDEFGIPDKLAGAVHDVSELKKREELQKRIEEEKRRLNEIKEHDKLRTEFFANISHELRTPVNVIFSAIQMEEMMIKDQAGKSGYKDNKYLRMMKQNCYRLIRLINNLIDITKIDTDFFQVNKVNNDIVSLVENVTLSVAEYIKDRDISIIFDTDIEEKIIACDPEKIERIILNLLSNAVKFTTTGGSINVKIEDNVNDICIRVKDTGRGIPASKLNSIFERFVQVDKSLKRSHEGSGIGLSIVKALVELHGGTISVMSEEGIGTEFIIHIPCKLAEGEAFINSGANKQIDKYPIEKISIEFSDIYD